MKRFKMKRFKMKRFKEADELIVVWREGERPEDLQMF